MLALFIAATIGCFASPEPASSFRPGARTLLHAHNCYPENGRGADRLERALSTGLPIAIEQDLVWCSDSARSVVAHDPLCGGDEPSLEQHFFERIRPYVEEALERGDRADWPLIVLHLNVRTEEPTHLAEIRRGLAAHADWLTTVPRTADPETIAELELRPLIAITEYSAAREQAFHDDLLPGEPLYVFGAVPAPQPPAGASRAERADWFVEAEPFRLMEAGRTNYRRFWNGSWWTVERGGQRKAADWTESDRERLDSLVAEAHSRGLFIRFYNLNGHPHQDRRGGWSPGYNFGSLAAVRVRWRAARQAGVDLLATDQYELLAEELASSAER
jgi:hypothetical protein